MLRPLGIDNTVIVVIFPLNTMTQAQLDLQKQAQFDLQTQLEQATPTDLITRPLSNDSPVLHVEISEQTPPTFLEQVEHTRVDTKIQNLLLHKMILIIHKQHHLLQKSDMKL